MSDLAHKLESLEWPPSRVTTHRCDSRGNPVAKPSAKLTELDGWTHEKLVEWAESAAQEDIANGYEGLHFILYAYYGSKKICVRWEIEERDLGLPPDDEESDDNVNVPEEELEEPAKVVEMPSFVMPGIGSNGMPVPPPPSLSLPSGSSGPQYEWFLWAMQNYQAQMNQQLMQARAYARERERTAIMAERALLRNVDTVLENSRSTIRQLTDTLARKESERERAMEALETARASQAEREMVRQAATESASMKAKILQMVAGSIATIGAGVAAKKGINIGSLFGGRDPQLEGLIRGMTPEQITALVDSNILSHEQMTQLLVILQKYGGSEEPEPTPPNGAAA